MRILQSIWTYVLIGLLAGALLVTTIYDAYPSRLILHFGDALIVAAIIGGLLHVREVSELFQTLARKTLIEEEYLRKLGTSQLRRIRSLTLRLTVEKAVNNPMHAWEGLVGTIDREVFSTYLPNEREPRLGIYRADYDEAIAIKHMSLHQALIDAEVEIPDGIANDPRLNTIQIRKHTTETTFEIVSPRTDAEIEFTFPLSFNVSEVSLFEGRKRVRAAAGENEDSALPVDLGEPKIRLGQVEFSSSHSVMVKGSRRLWFKTEEWYAAEDARFLLNTMSFLTRGVSVSVSSDQPFKFGGGIFGIGKQDPSKAMEHGISLSYDNWLLEDNGYIIWWEP